MLKSLGIRIGILLILLTLTFSTVALADQGATFRLLLEDTTTGKQRVITDQVSLGLLNANGDKNAALGTIGFNSSVGNFFVTINATSNQAADGGGILTLSANVAFQSTGTDQFVAVLEDVYGADTNGANATLENTIGGYNSTSNTVTSTAVLSSSASLTVQSWLDASGAVPQLGNNSGPAALTVDASKIATPGAYNNNVAPANATSGSYDKAVTSGITAPALTSIYSEAVVLFTSSSAGSVNFTLTAAETPATPSLPEPTSLVLLGSALLGLGVLRSRNKIRD